MIKTFRTLHIHHLGMYLHSSDGSFSMQSRDGRDVVYSRRVILVRFANQAVMDPGLGVLGYMPVPCIWSDDEVSDVRGWLAFGMRGADEMGMLSLESIGLVADIYVVATVITLVSQVLLNAVLDCVDVVLHSSVMQNTPLVPC